jgi:predicted O-methyltransferase YrrM|tara:strand:- start:141 stop:1031 length:891 start_codon:yes stop_codon:yes gene_type:complete
MPIVNSLQIQELIDSLEVKIPSKEKFLQLSNICPIDPLVDDSINFERGILLYALIAKHKFKNVLEIGTAEGYSTLCMAWAMTDSGINGKIFTIDPKPFDVPIKRISLWDKNQNNKVVTLSTKKLWEKFAEKDWVDKIEVLTGTSGEILKKMSDQLPRMDFEFIDGHHAYNSVLHDFYASLQITSKNFCILFDDYFKNSDVAKVIDEKVFPNFDATIIKTNEKTQKSENDPLEELEMCWIESSSLKKPLEEIYTKDESNKIINEYLKWEKRWKLRKSINQKLPFLKKIKFNPNSQMR